MEGRPGDVDIAYGKIGTAYWSGATLGDLQSGAEFMMNALGLTKSPVQWCPGVTP